MSCMTMTWPRPSLIGFLKKDASLSSMGRLTVPATLSLTAHQALIIMRPEFPENRGQNFRNPQHASGYVWRHRRYMPQSTWNTLEAASRQISELYDTSETPTDALLS